MKKQYKKYFFLSIIFTLLLFALGIVIRYIIDPVGINNKVNLGLYKDVALAYRIQKFVELNKVKPNTIILGGSRVHYLNPKDLEKYTNDKVYNLGLSYATLEEQYYFLKYSIEHFKIKNVVIGLNLYPFLFSGLLKYSLVLLLNFENSALVKYFWTDFAPLGSSFELNGLVTNEPPFTGIAKP